MKYEHDKLSRRNFLKTAGAIGAASTLTTLGVAADASNRIALGPEGTVPTRKFGKSGVEVSILGLGSMFDIPSNQLLLKQALKWGVTYWDTADCYEGGRSEKGFGQYFSRYPEDRKRIFLVTKSDERGPDGMTKLLEQSLERMNTSYIDLYFVHGIRRISELDNDTKVWAEKAKAQGKIKLFGFSTHSNMEECMTQAAKLGWIDGIMMTYNYRLMHTDDMKNAVDACVKAGIGLTAMKTQGGGSISMTSDTETAMAGRFLDRGFTEQQAKLKAIWENPHIASICSQMPNMTILLANAAAAMDKTHLSSTDHQLLRQYAMETCAGYCKGCSSICESRIDTPIPVGDVMRYLMYARSYGDRYRAMQLFNEIPHEIRSRILQTDFSSAERKCPQKMEIGKLMREALAELS